MIYFPQLSSGAAGQFPIKRQRIRRTVVNQSVQGYEIKLADPGYAMTEWHLSFDEMSDQELAALETLFQAVEGSLTPFTFVDPADNLLAWSGQLNEQVWQSDPLLAVTAGLADPLGGMMAFQVTNPSAAILQLVQSINAPASLQYCLSVYVRSDQSTRVWAIRGSESDSRTIGPQWTRVTSAGQLANDTDSIAFGVALDPGTTVDIFGFQVEAQPSPSLYKQTSGTGGVYPNARLKSDVLTITTAGPSRHSCELDIVNVEYL